MGNTNYLHEIECVDLVHHIHEFNVMNEIEKTINFGKNCTINHFLWIVSMWKKNGKKGCKQISTSWYNLWNLYSKGLQKFITKANLGWCDMNLSLICNFTKKIQVILMSIEVKTSMDRNNPLCNFLTFVTH